MLAYYEIVYVFAQEVDLGQEIVRPLSCFVRRLSLPISSLSINRAPLVSQ